MDERQQDLENLLASRKKLNELQRSYNPTSNVDYLSEQPASALPLPNGGLEGQALTDYIKQNPGPVAATGFNPANPGNTESAEPSLFSRVPDKLKNKQESGNVGTSGLASHGPASKSSSSPEAEEENQDSISSRQSAPVAKPSSPYGDDLNDEALKSQQNTANFLRMAGMLGNAGSTIGSALSRGAAKDVAIGDDTIKGADQGVKNLLQRREGKDAESKREKALLELNDEKAASDPNSSLSKTLRDGLKTVIPGLSIPEGTSALQLKNMGFNMGTLVSAKIAADARRDAALQRKDDKKEAKGTADELKYGKEGRQVIQSIERDPTVLKAQQPLQRLGKAKEMLEGTLPLDSQLLSDIEQDILAATSGSAGGSLGKLTRTERETAFRKFAELKQKVGLGTQDLREADPKTVAQVKKVVESLYENYDHDVKEQKRQLAETFKKTHGNFPNLKDYLGELSSYKRKSTTSNEGSAEDKEAIEWAKNNKGTEQAKQILKLHGLE